MNCQRQGTNLTIECNINANVLGIAPLSSRASIADKKAFLRATGRARQAEAVVRDLLKRIDAKSGAGIMDADEHEALLLQFGAD